MAPKFGALALSRIDWPEMPTVWATPGVGGRPRFPFTRFDPSAASSTTSIARCVRATEAASGSCTLTSR